MYYQLKSLILKERVSAEADKLITFYTLEWGKVIAVVPGAKKIKAKLSAATEPVMESDLMVYVTHPSARAKVTGAAIVESFTALRRDWRRFVMAQSCAEIADVLTPLNAENPKKYELLSRTWKLLETAKHPWRIFAAFSLRFLKLSGYSFTEYINHGATGIPETEKRLIHRLATRSGEDVDRDNDVPPGMEKKITGHLYAYLNLYVPYPLATREFWKKIDKKGDTRH